MSGASGPLVFLIAGEPSGDAIGARIMAALRRCAGGAMRFAGIGGEAMEAEGLTSLFPMSDLTLFGAAEVVPKVPLILRRVRETVAEIERLRPDMVLSVDVPGFAFRVQEKLPEGLTLRVHCVAPTVWAYRPGRARRIARFLDHLLVLLPFEPPYFEREGLACTHIGHPVLESGAGAGDGPAFRERHGIPREAPLLAVLPGSRRGEVARLLPVFGEVVERLAAGRPGLRVVVPTVPAVADAVTAAAARFVAPTTVLRGSAEKYDAFAAADAALAASGTVTMELAMARLPMVVAYKVNPLTAMWLRRIIRVRHVTLVNLVLDRALVPEFLQDRCTAGFIAPAVADLLDGGEARERQRVGLDEALELFAPGQIPPSEKAAEAVRALLARR